MEDSMRGLFYIVKGQYRKGVAPSYPNKATGETSYIGGFDPERKDTVEWYMLLDCKTFNCVSCGTNYDKVLKAVHTMIKKFKGSAKKYFKYVSDTTSDDYYEVTYLGRKPLDRDGYIKKAEGRCPRVSPPMRCLHTLVYEEYGDYFSDDIEEMEDLAYKELKEDKPINKTRKLVSKNKSAKKLVKAEVKEEKVIDTSTPKKMVKPKVKLGVKKLSMN